MWIPGVVDGTRLSARRGEELRLPPELAPCETTRGISITIIQFYSQPFGTSITISYLKSVLLSLLSPIIIVIITSEELRLPPELAPCETTRAISTAIIIIIITSHGHYHY